MSTTGAVVLTLLVLAASGVVPVLLAVGPRLVALPLLPLAGALCCGVAAVSEIALFGSLLLWFVLWAVGAFVVSAVVLVTHPALRQRRRRQLAALRHGVRPLLVIGGVAVVAATVPMLWSLKVPSVGFDTRAIWMLHARWLSHGHTFALAAIRNRFLVVSHPGYPPLVSSVMAFAWRLTGTSSARVGVVMVALVNACALFVAGWGIIEVARRGAVRLHAGQRGQQLVLAAGVLVAALTVLVAGGVVGLFATNGYADVLWSFTAVAAVVFGLVLPPTPSNLAVTALLLGVTGLTKVEGIAVAGVFVILIAVRVVVRRQGRPWVPIAGAAAAIVALLVWPLLTIIAGVPSDPSISGQRDGSLSSRAHSTISAMWPHLHVVVLALVCSVLGGLFLRAVRGRLGLANDLWPWVALIGATAVLAGAYVFGPGNVELWLATSVNRTTIFEALLAWWIVALWALSGVAGASLLERAQVPTRKPAAP
ncbi:MAG TPA: hypothetical protein VHV57_10185 [Acidimicrobiales bacterium]|nr:hypothetical protein [Acidimicrobiales bacterium]